MFGSVPPLALRRIVGGFGVANRKRVDPVSGVTLAGVVLAVVVAAIDDVVVPDDVALMVCAPLPTSGRSVLVSWRSSRPVSAGLKSSSMYSS